MKPIIFTSLLAANADFIGEMIADYAGRKLQIPTQFIGNLSTLEREHLFDDGHIQVCWMCGLLYTWKIKRAIPLTLLAAPVLEEIRYQNRPIYFSDVVVHVKSRFVTFEDLDKASWAYNDPGSHSGCFIVRSHLAALGKNADFFSKIVQSGAHQLSLQMVLNQQVDASALDSTVLDMELKNSPEISGQIRVIETIGPSPIPPWVIRNDVSAELQMVLQSLFLNMQNDSEGRDILRAGLLKRFDPVADQDYHPIRLMADEAEQVPWPAE
ncbi:MAG: PhnD/SsuA/transferrin family substrate-binding protein [SAR324 cluster bacterium]|nr:PhnD/SsuA/transferrin family substrate-binding protein [SAR324 cluster bacterium]